MCPQTVDSGTFPSASFAREFDHHEQRGCSMKPGVWSNTVPAIGAEASKPLPFPEDYSAQRASSSEAWPAVRSQIGGIRPDVLRLCGLRGLCFLGDETAVQRLRLSVRRSSDRDLVCLTRVHPSPRAAGLTVVPDPCDRFRQTGRFAPVAGDRHHLSGCLGSDRRRDGGGPWSHRRSQSRGVPCVVWAGAARRLPSQRK